MRRQCKKIIIYGSIYLVLLGGLVFVFGELFDIESFIGDDMAQIGRGSLWEAIRIAYNNLKNFLGYLLIYPLYPLMYLKDLIFTSWMVVVSFRMQGVRDTFFLLLPHAVLEIPNFILFTYLSFLNFKSFWKEKNVTGKVYVGRIWKYRYHYLVCFALLLVASLVEGLVTKKMYWLFIN
ncbi:hypothetical protein E5329_26960 [Petralouisia muris]|uniref:Uncharacterized protein n=1 Tax=Petralouisia muris TaxID=3032872 RepID=A0AC61RMX9_9FIRM|nr:stage II sporulation protein M [Petralouisia muris]TGY87128.1 hypothetical protein E5329_26960 [Petralouisia muris]